MLFGHFGNLYSQKNDWNRQTKMFFFLFFISCVSASNKHPCSILHH